MSYGYFTLVLLYENSSKNIINNTFSICTNRICLQLSTAIVLTHEKYKIDNDKWYKTKRAKVEVGYQNSWLRIMCIFKN